jgi:hypothetical protein
MAVRAGCSGIDQEGRAVSVPAPHYRCKKPFRRRTFYGNGVSGDYEGYTRLKPAEILAFVVPL